MSIGHTKNLPALPLGLLAPDPGDFLCGQKVTKKPLKKLRFLRIFLHYGGFLFALRPVCLVFLNLFSGPMPLESLEPLPSPLAFFVGFASERHGSFHSAGPPARCGRYRTSCRGRMAHSLRSPAGSSAWRAGGAKYNILPISPGERAAIQEQCLTE